MRRATRASVLGAALLAAGLPLGAAEPRLQTRLEPSQITVGDHAELSIELRLPPDVPQQAVSWPAWETRLGEAEILATGGVESAVEGTEQVLRQSLTLTAFRTGSISLPEVVVTIARPDGEQTLTSAPAVLEIISVLPPGDELPEAKPAAPPRRLELGMGFWWLTASLLALSAAGIVWLARSSRSRQPAGEAARLAPLEELSRAIADLRHDDDVVGLHAGASMALRRYLGRSLGFTAPESTTTEVGRALRRQRLESDLLRPTIELLTLCDMVKFARQKVDLGEASARLDRVETLARRIEGWLHPATESEAAETEGPSGSGPPLAEAS